MDTAPPVDCTMHDQPWAGHREPLMAGSVGHQCSAGQRLYQQQPLQPSETMLSGPWSCCVKRSISADLVTALRLLLSCDYE